MSNESGKQYGLILPKKTTVQDVIQRPSVFDEGSDGEPGLVEGDWIKKAYQREAMKAAEKKQTKTQIQKALTQDPTIYQYDEVYDEMKDKSNKTAPKKDEKKTETEEGRVAPKKIMSRYIQSLKRNAERRKLENERRLERQVQKERQEEGEEFKDKETFVTSAYKKKLEEFKKMDEEEKRIDRLEEIGDVSKQKDISGFYRHLYKTTVDTEQSGDKKDEDIKKDKEEKVDIVIKKSPSKELNKEPLKPPDLKKQKRQYRKRTKSGSSREEGEKTSSSSTSSSSSSSSSESEDDRRSKVKKQVKDDTKQIRDKSPDKKKRSLSKSKENIEHSSKHLEDSGESKKKKSETILDNEKIKTDTKNEFVNDLKSVQDHKPSVNIWLKRTVGANFDDALRRYLERKSKRQGSY